MGLCFGTGLSCLAVCGILGSPKSPPLEGEFLTTVPPGSPSQSALINHIMNSHMPVQDQD